VRLDLPIQLESGVSATIDAQFAPMLNEAGKITNIIFSAIDVTERKQAEEFLVDAQQQAELANQAKSEFLANMSHEIRTPMTAIIGYTDVLLENELDQQKRNWLLTIQRNGNFLLEIINDILDLSKIEAGRFEIDSQLFSPVAVVEDVRSVMDVRAQQNGLQLSVDYQGKLPVKIRSDLKRLKQILINLVGNAVKFTRTGSVKIVVDYESSDAPEIRIDVIDTGIGIAVDMQEELFQPFSQGEARISRDYGGTGLGLTISRRLAQMLGGHISVQSTVGVGSTFTIRMPVGVPAVELIDAESLEHPPEEVAPRAIELSCRVLVVDDRRDIRLLSRRLLTSSGADVTEAEDGVVAVERVSRLMEANEPLPDLILLDMQMPRMNGYDTAKQLRKMGFSGPIIALTAEAMEGDLQRCLDFGCDAYLSKPINAHKLRSTVQSYTS
jgi:signal transduction histidine kinase/ActR/RegA family two-component response regulator